MDLSEEDKSDTETVFEERDYGEKESEEATEDEENGSSNQDDHCVKRATGKRRLISLVSADEIHVK